MLPFCASPHFNLTFPRLLSSQSHGFSHNLMHEPVLCKVRQRLEASRSHEAEVNWDPVCPHTANSYFWSTGQSQQLQGAILLHHAHVVMGEVMPVGKAQGYDSRYLSSAALQLTPYRTLGKCLNLCGSQSISRSLPPKNKMVSMLPSPQTLLHVLYWRSLGQGDTWAACLPRAELLGPPWELRMPQNCQ